jgi:hypothetical protein
MAWYDVDGLRDRLAAHGGAKRPSRKVCYAMVNARVTRAAQGDRFTLPRPAT